MCTYYTLYFTPNAVLSHKYAEIGKAACYDDKNLDFYWKSAWFLSLLRFFFGFGLNMPYL